MTESKPFSLAPYLDILYRHRRAAAGVFVVGLSVTLSLMALLRDVYVASAAIIIEPPRVASSYVSMTSERTENVKIADQLEGIAHRAFTDAWLEQLIVRFGLYHVRPSQQPGNRSLDFLVKYMRQQMTLVVPPDTIRWEGGHSEGSSTVILTLSFEYFDRYVVQRVTSELARRLIEEGQKEKSDRAADATRFLQTQVARARAQLDLKAEQKKALEQRYQGSLPEELPANLEQLDRLEDQLRMLNERMSLGPTFVPTEGPATLSPEQQLASLKLKLNRLRAEYSDEYPDVVDLKAEISSLEAQIRSKPAAPGEKGSPHGGAATNEGQLEQQAAVISQKIQILQRNIALTPEHGQEVATLNRDYDTLAVEYHRLFQNQMAAELRQTLERRHQDESLHLLNPVNLPKAPKSPNRLAIGAVGTLLSLAAGLALPFCLFFTDTSFRATEELEVEYGIHVVATIPVVDEEKEERRATMQAFVFSFGGVLLVVGSLFAYAQWFRS